METGKFSNNRNQEILPYVRKKTQFLTPLPLAKANTPRLIPITAR
jgi:hypothetical protein